MGATQLFQGLARAVLWVSAQPQGSKPVLAAGKDLTGSLLSVVLAPGSRGPGGWRWPWC